MLPGSVLNIPWRLSLLKYSNITYHEKKGSKFVLEYMSNMCELFSSQKLILPWLIHLFKFSLWCCAGILLIIFSWDRETFSWQRPERLMNNPLKRFLKTGSAENHLPLSCLSLLIYFAYRACIYTNTLGAVTAKKLWLSIFTILSQRKQCAISNFSWHLFVASPVGYCHYMPSSTF